MTISGDERLIHALGFAEIQTARETQSSVAITDAHSGNIVAADTRFNGNTIINALNNVDLRLGANFAVRLEDFGSRISNVRIGDDLVDRTGYGTFEFLRHNDHFIMHIASSATVLQIGANEGESLNVSFGDLRARALGVDRVSVLSRETASRAITMIDNAIDIVSMRRARLGAYQNRLEHTISNLSVAGENLTASESRIRDADMAREMMNFTKLSIMLQAGTSMLAQANQLPQSILGLIR